MSIRLKLALILTAAIAAATLAAGMVFVSLQYSSLRSDQRDKRELLVQSVARLESESLLARDPLMLLDYLQALRREHKEVLRCRAFIDGKWETVGDQDKDDSAVLVEEALPNPAPAVASPLKTEIGFSRAAISDLERQALGSLLRDVGRAGAVVAFLALVIALPLSWTLTRRVVIIQRALADIGEGKLGEKIPPLGYDEIGRLGAGFNLMSERLQELDKLKKTFVASVTHELRSPLGAIEAYVKELLASPDRLSDQDRAALERVQNNARRLSHFVTNLLDMAKIERGKLDFSPRSCDVSEIVQDTAQFFAPSAQNAGLALSCHIEPGLARVNADPDLIAHVLTNFLSNALKFTKAGGKIQVDLRRKEDCLECSVNDSGVGIAAQDIGRVFAPFQRVANPLRATGVGLGLAISKSIIEMHGGTVGLQSELGRGSRFYFRLPLSRGPAAVNPASPQQPAAAS